MSIEFRIVVQGVAMSYEKTHNSTKYWGILFPFDENCHTLRMKNSEDDTTISLAKPLRKIEISVAGTALSTHDRGSDYEDFINLTQRADTSVTPPLGNLHHNGLTLRGSWYKHGILLKLNNAVLSVRKRTGRRLAVVKREALSDVVKPFKYVGLSGEAVITTNDESSLLIEVKEYRNIDDYQRNARGKVVYSRVFSREATITFDNDCYDADANSESDFPMLYWLVQDRNTESREFFIKKETYPITLPAEALSEQIRAFDIDVLFRILNGIFIESQGVKGLPCHKVRVEDPTGLPDLDF